MSYEIRIRPGVLIIERKDGIFVGHVGDQLILPDLHLRAVLRRLLKWQSIEEIHYESAEVTPEDLTNVVKQLHMKNFLEKRNPGVLEPEIVITHMNEIGLAVAPQFYEDGFSVSTWDKRNVQLADVHGAFVRVANHKETFQEILSSQLREMINSGHVLKNADRTPSTSSLNSSVNAPLHSTLHTSRRDSRFKNPPSGAELRDNREQLIALVTTYPEPELLAFLMENQITHLFVSATAFGALIGPLVEPGKSPCFHCVELHRSDRDPHWQNVALTLFSDRFDRAPAASTHLASAITADFVRSLVRNERVHQPLARITTFHLPSAAPITHDWQPRIREEGHTWTFHPECSCHWNGGLSTRVK